MKSILHKKTAFNLAVMSLLIFSGESAFAISANQLPGSVNAGRFEAESTNSIFLNDNKKISITKVFDAYQYPKEAKNFKFHLKKVIIQGNNAFSNADFESLYEKDLGKEVTLDKIWYIAQKITEKYQGKGYFLTRAYVPAQEVENGVIKINITEGYIGKINFNDKLSSNPLVKEIIKKLEECKPITTEALETAIIRLNDLRGAGDYKAVMHRIDNANLKEGAAQLTITPNGNNYKAFVGVDNQNSKFNGPYEISASFSKNFYNVQNTTISTIFDPHFNKTKSISLNHKIPVSLDTSINMSASYTEMTPKNSIAYLHLKSKSKQFAPSVIYRPIRLQNKNLSFTLKFDIKNSETRAYHSSIINKDNVRAIKFETDFSFLDMINSYNSINIKLNKGIRSFGSSKKSDPNLTNAGTNPNYTSAQLEYSRQDNISKYFILISQATGQLSSSTLFPSEQIGFGGKKYGQAYDPNEITGDVGALGSLELLYTQLKQFKKTSFYPYINYDIGTVKNKHHENNSKYKFTAASTGFGVKFNNDFGLVGNVGVYWPLVKKIANPLYGNGKNPRYIASISYKF